MSLSNFLGTWKRTGYDEKYESLLTILGQGWIARKAIMNTSYSREFKLEGDVVKDNSYVVGQTVALSYSLSADAEAAAALRAEGNAYKNDHKGQVTEVVAYLEGEVLVVDNLVDGKVRVTYRFSLTEGGTVMTASIHAEGPGSDNVDTVVNFAKQ